MCAKLLKVATVILAAVNIYSSLQYLVVGDKPQGRAIGYSPPAKGWGYAQQWK
jgi:hypothetical protein